MMKKNNTKEEIVMKVVLYGRVNHVDNEAMLSQIDMLKTINEHI